MGTIREILMALKSALTWWIVVAPWEQAIRVRLGKRVRLLGAGVHLRIPGADLFYVQSTRARVSVLPSQTLTTSDGKALTIAVTVRYRIDDLLRLYQTLHHAEGTIANIVMGAVGEYVVTHSLSECGPASFGLAVTERSDLSAYGLADVAVTVVTFASVKTYRLITGEGGSFGYGDQLQTTAVANPVVGPY